MTPVKRRRICVVTSPFLLSGRPILTNFLATFMPLAEDMFVITGDFPRDFIREKKVHIKNITYNMGGKKSTLTGIIQFVSAQLRVSANLIKIVRRVDLIIFILAADLVLPMLVAKLLGNKVLLVVGGSASKAARHLYEHRLWGMGGFIFSRFLAILETVTYSLSDRIVVYSPGMVSHLGLDKYRDKILVDGAGFVNTKLFQPRKKLCERGNLVGCIGRLSKEKGVMNLLEAIPLILKQWNDGEFLIGGDGSLFSEIEKELKNSEFKEKVKITGWIPHNELPDYFNEMKLVILPSYTEGLPLSILEAMACGTPVLATPVGGIPDVVKDSETGFIMEDNSPECIARNVIRVLSYPSLDKIAANARNLIEREYTLKAAVERYDRILNSLGSRL